MSKLDVTKKPFYLDKSIYWSCLTLPNHRSSHLD